jgi:hypothetical protein
MGMLLVAVADRVTNLHQVIKVQVEMVAAEMLAQEKMDKMDKPILAEVLEQVIIVQEAEEMVALV